MNPLQEKVKVLFDQDRQLNALEKTLKTRNAHYQHLLLKNTERVFVDAEVLQIHSIYHELQALQAEKKALLDSQSIVRKEILDWLIPLSGGRWVHETEDPIHPRWEFWAEGDELKFARLNGANYE